MTDGLIQILLGGGEQALFERDLEAILKSGPLPYRLQWVIPPHPTTR